MAGTGILDNQVISQRRARQIRDIYGEAENKRNAIRQRTHNDILSQQSAIAAFNQRIAQMNSQTVLASVFQQQQLMNKRAADIEAARAAYQQHYEQYGSALNESALRFLDQHAKIDVPTFTSIMAGYEHAKASAEQRDRERIEAQVAMAEKSGALDKERAALIEKEIQARMEPEIQAYKSQIEMANARIKMLENQAADDAKFQLDKANAIARAFGGNGSGNAGLGASSLGNFGSRRGKGEGGNGEPDWDAQLANLESMRRKYPEVAGSLAPWIYSDQNNKIGLYLIQGLNEKDIIDNFKNTNKEAYEEYIKQRNKFAENNAKFESKSESVNFGGADLGYGGQPNKTQSEIELDNKSSVIPENLSKEVFDRWLATSLIMKGDKEVVSMLNGATSGEKIANSPRFLNLLASSKRRLEGDLNKYRESNGKNLISDENVKRSVPAIDWTVNAEIVKASPELMAAISGLDPNQTMPEEYSEVVKAILETGYGKDIPIISLEEMWRDIYGGKGVVLDSGDKKLIKGVRNAADLRAEIDKGNAEIDAQKAELEAARAAALAQAQAVPANQQDIINIITEEANRYGIDPQIMVTMARNESGLNPNIVNESTNATGLFQFLPSTWRGSDKGIGMVQKYSNEGLTLEGISDPRQNARAAALYLREHQNAFNNAGIPINGTSLYMGNFLGTQGALDFFSNLQSNPNQSAASIFPKAASKNEAIFYTNGRERSLQEVYDLMGKKMGIVAQQQQTRSDAPWF